MNIDIINQWLSGLGLAPLVGAVIIACATLVAAKVVRVLGNQVALLLSRWSGLGIRAKVFGIIRRPLWVSVILIGILVEVQWLAPPDHVEFLVAGMAKTVLAILWIIVLGQITGLIFARLSTYYPGGSELFRLGENLGTVAVVVVGVLVVLTIWQVNLTPLIASAGIAGVIAALAAKELLGNFFGGISLYLDRPFRMGDYIDLSSGERGKVVHIGLRSTRIQTRDDVLITVPNSVIINTKVINENAPDWRMRLRIKVSVANPCDLDQVKETLLKLAGENPLVLEEPRPRVRFRSFGDSCLDFELLCWITNPADKGRVIDQMNTAIYNEFNKVGIPFPLPQRDIYLHQIVDKQGDGSREMAEQ
jgi:MscS family membrane protein